jgi:serine protease Do
MLMNKPTVIKFLALGALGMVLTALPGSSSGLQEPDTTAIAKVQTKICAMEARAQQLADKLSTQQAAWTNLQEVERLQAPEPEEFEVFIGDSGSWLGVETKEVSAETVQKLKLPAERGALVGKIIPDSPAAKAGLKENDVITEVNGQRVEGTAQFRRMIREIPAGRSAQLTLFRDGHAQSVSVKLGKSEPRHATAGMLAPTAGAFTMRLPEVDAMPEIVELGNMSAFASPVFAQPRLGIDAEDLQGELDSYFGAPDGEGVLIRGVLPDSAAAKAGFKSGDVITSLNGQRIRTIRELREQMRSLKDEQPLKIGLLRNKAELSLSVTLPAPAKKEIHQRSERSTM